MLAAADLALLCLGTFAVSLFVSAVGPTGGVQLAVVATILPAPLVIPVHAWITGVSAVFRAWGLRQWVDWRYVLVFAVPSVAAAAVAAQLSFGLDPSYLQITIGAYVIASSIYYWLGRGPWIGSLPGGRWLSPGIAGAVTGFVTVFIGATGPLLFSLMAPVFDRKERLVGTHSCCLVIQHFSKIVIFGVMGAAIFSYPVMLIGTLLAALAGTLLGRRVLLAIPERSYRMALTVIMVASGLLIIARAV